MTNKVTIELPCQIGQTVYYINKYKKKVDTDEVRYFTVTKTGINPIMVKHNRRFWDSNEWGETVFLTEAEAQEAFRKWVSNEEV